MNFQEKYLKMLKYVYQYVHVYNHRSLLIPLDLTSIMGGKHLKTKSYADGSHIHIMRYLVTLW